MGVLAEFHLRDSFYPSFYSGENSAELKLSHKPLCHAIKKEIELKDDEFEYMPTSYSENICNNPERSKNEIISQENHMCTFPGFECVQRQKNLMIAKRRKGTEIWQFYNQRIASDCECMLPVFELPAGFPE